LNDLHNNLTIW